MGSKAAASGDRIVIGSRQPVAINRRRPHAIRQLLTSPSARLPLAWLFLLAVFAVFGQAISGLTVDRIDLAGRLAAPNSEHWFGTDANGRDVFTRWCAAAGISLSVAVVAVSVSIPVGTFLGLLSGFFGGLVDAVVMRLADAVLSVPNFLLLLIMFALFKPSLETVVVVIGLTTWMAAARIVRSEVQRVAPQEFVLAARAVGATDARVLAKHLLPAVTPYVIVAATVGVPQAILLESTLSFFGLGVQPPTPTWGNMLADAQQYVWNAPLLALWPGLAILFTVLSLNTLGEAFRVVLDPYSAGRGDTR
jgi:peptide/nickel transport system permease protein